MENLFGFLQQGLSGVFAITVLLGLLIFVHELGHFLVAKWFGVGVEVFSLGFGKRILEYKKNGTVYCISLFPLGGYVKMFGDDPTRDIPEEQKKLSYLHKPVGQRIAIVLAGPLMNFFFAIFLFFVIAQVGEKTVPSVLGDIASDSPAFEQGFRSGDQVTSVNKAPILYWEELAQKIQKNPGKKLSFQLKRDGQELEVSAQPVLQDNPNILSTKSQVGSIEGLSPISSAPVIGISDPQSPAARAGIQSGAILKVNGIEVETLRALKKLIAEQSSSGELVFTHSNRFDLEKKDLIESKIKTGSTTFEELGFLKPETFISEVISGTPADLAGLKKNDRIVEIDGKEILHWEQILNRIKSFKPEEPPVPIAVVREGQLERFKIKPKMTSRMNSQGQEEYRFQIGIKSAEMRLPPPTVVRKFENVFAAFNRGVEKTWHFTSMISMSFVRLFQAEISPKNIGGVITISQAASETFKVGITQYLQMMAIISINLFLINLLPIPLLDGGHLLFYLIEALRGAPISLKKMEVAQQIGLLILVSLMVFAFFNDITRIMQIQW